MGYTGAVSAKGSIKPKATQGRMKQQLRPKRPQAARGASGTYVWLLAVHRRNNAENSKGSIDFTVLRNTNLQHVRRYPTVHAGAHASCSKSPKSAKLRASTACQPSARLACKATKDLDIRSAVA